MYASKKDETLFVVGATEGRNVVQHVRRRDAVAVTVAVHVAVSVAVNVAVRVAVHVAVRVAVSVPCRVDATPEDTVVQQGDMYAYMCEYMYKYLCIHV